MDHNNKQDTQPTMSFADFMDEKVRGKKVYTYVKVGMSKQKISGMAGWAWSESGNIPIVKFDSGHTVFIDESTAVLFHLELTN